MNGLRACLILAAVALQGCQWNSAIEPPADPPQRVLFVGNSFTFYNNGLHSHYRALVAERAGAPGRVRALTLSGGRLREHRAGLRQRLAEQRWDAVLLQGHRNAPLMDPERFREAASNHAARIRAGGARPYLLMTWAYTGEPEMTAQLDALYRDAAERAGAEVVPAGLAFALVTEAHPEISLRTEDLKHPTVAGTYLTACVAFATLLGESPVGLAYTAGLPETVASTLQRAAWQTAQAFDARPRSTSNHASH